MIPIPVIVHHHDEPDLCPECKKEEQLKIVCAHCGYEYPEEEDSGGWVPWSVWLGVILIVALFISLFCGWVIHCDVYPEYKSTFIQYLGEVCQKVSGLLKRIW